MIHKLVLILSALCINVYCQAQLAKMNPEQSVRFLADAVLAHTSYQLMDFETGEVFTESENLPVKESIKVKSKLTDWKYQNGVMNLAMLIAGEVLDEKKYTNFVVKNYNFVLDHYNYFKKQFEDEAINKSSLKKLYDFHYLDDCGTMGAALIGVYQMKGQDKKEFKEILDRSSDYILNKEFRLEDGTLCREYPRKGAVWADDLYMSTIFLSKMGAFTGETKYFDEAAFQIIQFTKYLCDDKLKIYNHAYFHNENITNGAFWGRANGWVMMSQVELLNVLPKDHPKRDELIQILREHVRGIARLQSQSGLWHQLLDKNDSYLESSCTAMYTYSIAKAVNEGWVDSAWSQVAWKGWQGLYSNITEDAQVKDICVGTHIEMSQAFYYNRPKSVNDTHGLASTILAGCEIHKMSKQYAERISPQLF